MIRSERRDAALEASILESVDSIDATLERIRPRPMTYWVEESVSEERVSLVLAALVGLAALVLAAIGIYGVLTFLVQRRRRELAIRMALGARSRHIGKLVLGESLRLTIAGVVLGVAGFALVAPVLESQLFGVGLFDAASALGSLVVLTTVALLATLLPSRTAVCTSPLELLRED
jgi:ABC-type antimicrobial peptide transport system permease subunit